MPGKGLGRGLGALLGNAADQPASEGNTVMLRISEIEPNADQPRKEFDQDALSDLADSLRTRGLISPIMVRRLPSGSYQIIAGERRWRAARMAGLSLLPAIVREVDDRIATELALVENEQREDLNVIEVAEAFRRLIDMYGMTQEEVSSVAGRSRSAVANIVRLLTLSDTVMQMVREGRLSEGHARTLLSLTPKQQEHAALRMADGGMTVRQAETFVKNLLEKEKADEPSASALNYLLDHEKQLSDKWGRKVSIAAGKKKGKIELEFYDADDLESLVGMLLK